MAKKKIAAAGMGASLVTSFAAWKLAQKYGIPVDVAVEGIGLIVAGFTSVVHYVGDLAAGRKKAAG